MNIVVPIVGINLKRRNLWRIGVVQNALTVIAKPILYLQHILLILRRDKYAQTTSSKTETTQSTQNAENCNAAKADGSCSSTNNSRTTKATTN